MPVAKSWNGEPPTALETIPKTIPSRISSTPKYRFRLLLSLSLIHISWGGKMLHACSSSTRRSASAVGSFHAMPPSRISIIRNISPITASM